MDEQTIDRLCTALAEAACITGIGYRAWQEDDLNVLCFHEAVTEWYGGAHDFSTQNYSYAMVDIRDGSTAREEWAETLNSEALVVADRNLGSANGTTGSSHFPDQSIWANEWHGSAVFNDNHAIFSNDSQFDLRYGNSTQNGDWLFQEGGASGWSSADTGFVYSTTITQSGGSATGQQH